MSTATATAVKKTTKKTSKKTTAKKAAENGNAPFLIKLPQLKVEMMEIPIVGDTPLIMNNFGKKSREEIARKQQQRAQGPKEAKDPIACYNEARYIVRQKGKAIDCIPARCFKKAAVAACTSLGRGVITKVMARQAFHVHGDLTINLSRIVGEPEMVEDVVRLQGTTADLRYRPYYNTWSTKIVVKFNKGVLSPEQIVNLFNTAGFAVGVGEWRPSCDGDNGMFHVDI